ncbi:UNVERIFIED_CONTAM: hypothetical protein PYX00_011680 [Menopon gallinae]|uniref:Uncharacterized protein n=1 Tax=Menopon gallinae TaxID=328185 RepID=A0AAW2H8D0_9NEOP
MRNARICVLARNHERGRRVSSALGVDADVCTYERSVSLLGRTCSAMVVCDFGHMTPSVLLRAFETVAGGGPIVLLFEDAQSRREVCNTSIDACKKYGTGRAGSRYFRRVLRHLLKSDFAATIRCGPRTARRLELRLSEAETKAARTDTCACTSSATVPMTADQLRAYEQLAARMKKTSCKAILCGPRGRGKSTVLGALAARAVIDGAARVVVTAPSSSCAEAVLAHCERLLTAADGLRVQRIGRERGKVVACGASAGVVEYVAPERVQTQDADLLVVDEAAALGHHALDRMLEARRVLLATTVGGYEGTGLSLAMHAPKRAEIHVVGMEQPVRYAADDPVERWLREKVLFDVGCAALGTNLNPKDCVLLAVSKKRLLRDEKALRALCSLFTQSHYRSTPDDLMAVVDCPRMLLVALCAGSGDGDVAALCAMQVAIEGPVGKADGRNGNQMTWALHDFHNAECFLRRTCARVVRIAVHPALRRRGIGSQCINALRRAFSERGHGHRRRWRVPSSFGVFAPLESCDIPAVDYVGVGFALEHGTLMFWLKNGYRPLYVRGGKSAQTGEHTLIVAKTVAPCSERYIAKYEAEFRRRFAASLRHSHAQLDARLCLQILDPGCFAGDDDWRPGRYDAKRMQKFVARFSDTRCVVDLLPAVAETLLFSRRLSATALEKCVLLMLGLQCRSPDDTQRALGLGPAHLRHVVCSVFEKLLAETLPGSTNDVY